MAISSPLKADELLPWQAKIKDQIEASKFSEIAKEVYFPTESSVYIISSNANLPDGDVYADIFCNEAKAAIAPDEKRFFVRIRTQKQGGDQLGKKYCR